VLLPLLVSRQRRQFPDGRPANYPIALRAGWSSTRYCLMRSSKAWCAVAGRLGRLPSVSPFLRSPPRRRHSSLSCRRFRLNSTQHSQPGRLVNRADRFASGIIVPDRGPLGDTRASLTDNTPRRALRPAAHWALLACGCAPPCSRILGTTNAGLVTGIAKWAPQSYSLRDLACHRSQLVYRRRRESRPARIAPCSASATSSTTSHALAGRQEANLFDATRPNPRGSTASCLSDAAATIVGSLTGPPPESVTSRAPLEWRSGGRTGVPPMSPRPVCGRAVHWLPWPSPFGSRHRTGV